MKAHFGKRVGLIAMAFVASLAMLPAQAAAFCGFYVGGAGTDLFADATQVVLMREGTKTVLSMQNRYSGPPNDFAMIIPVPVVLMEANVKTLSDDVFKKVDTLTSPRLVEYWEQDPCQQGYWADDRAFAPTAENDGGGNNQVDPGDVVVEAEFAVGEYTIQILSANDATALDTWLEGEGYNVPAGAAPYYQPYISQGMYFFAAKVDPTKVTFNAAGEAVLSPLRFDYDSADFQLPIRLGMINSAGQQDLIVYILARNQRYELENYPNAFIPTNIEVIDDVRNDFGTFYRSLFARTLKENPNAAITEYSWNAASCDPCPGPVQLDPGDIETLGGDVLSGQNPDQFGYFDWVITRLHMRYSKDEIGDDLLFRKADPVVGGRERHDENGVLEQGASIDTINNFQARFIIRHRWQGAVLCQDPQYERWGADPNGSNPYGGPAVTSNPSPNTTGGDVFDTSDAPALEERVRQDIPEINVVANPGDKASGGCSATSTESALPAGLALLLGLGFFGFRRRRS